MIKQLIYDFIIALPYIAQSFYKPFLCFWVEIKKSCHWNCCPEPLNILVLQIELQLNGCQYPVTNYFDHNKERKPITPETFKSFLNSLKTQVDRNENISLVTKQFFQCLSQEEGSNFDIIENPRHQADIIIEILDVLGATNVIINDVLRLSNFFAATSKLK